MSKEKPEVGDIFENKYKTRVRIVFVDKYEVRFYCAWGNYLSKESDGVSSFLENYKYLGKPRVSIEELFEVEEEK